MMFLTVVTFLVIAQCANTQRLSSVEYFFNLITKGEEQARHYRLPTSAKEHRSSARPTYFGKYDYIIIGSGSAGSVLASRLTEKKDLNVLVLEAGTFENDLTDIGNTFDLVHFSKYNWGFKTTPQKTSCLGLVENRCNVPRGKGVGGTSLINGLMYVRGNRHVFDKWAAQGNPGWSYEDVLPYFMKSEKSHIPNGDKGYHGKTGSLNVEYRHPHSPQLHAFLEANVEFGNHIIDYNGKTQLGVSPTQFTTIFGRRDSTGKAFIKPAIKRENLKLFTDSFVTRIIINNNKTATGVEFTHKGNKYIVDAKNEIILSAGAINSPQILQLSGIGPRRILEKYKIPVVEELAVGRHLHDDPSFYGLYFETNYTEPIRDLKEYIQEYLEGSGPLSIPANIQGVGFYQTPLARHKDIPDIEMMFVPANSTSEFFARFMNLRNETAEALLGNTDLTKTFRLQIIAVQSRSRGYVRIKSKNPFKYPIIKPKMLSDPHGRDIETIYEGIQMAFKIINTPAFRKMDAKYSPGPLPGCKMHEFLSKDYWYCAIRQVTISNNHHAGTCRMGPDPTKGAVVDSKLRVHGIKNLRVADVSVLPSPVAGHTNAVAILIGEILSDIIKAEIDFKAEIDCNSSESEK